MDDTGVEGCGQWRIMLAANVLLQDALLSTVIANVVAAQIGVAVRIAIDRKRAQCRIIARSGMERAGVAGVEYSPCLGVARTYGPARHKSIALGELNQR